MSSLYSIGLLSLTEIFADFALKKYATDGGLLLLTYGVAGYAGVVYLLIQVLRGFSDPNQYIGLGLIVAGLFFLKIPLH
jgi:hypothetical protein